MVLSQVTNIFWFIDTLLFVQCKAPAGLLLPGHLVSDLESSAVYMCGEHGNQASYVSWGFGQGNLSCMFLRDSVAM